MPKKSINKPTPTGILHQNRSLVDDIRKLIEDARTKVASSFNAAQSLLCWKIGKRVREDILQGNRAEYGKEILATVSQTLRLEYGNGYSYSALTRMVKFSEAFGDPKIVATLSQTLSWSHFQELLPIDNPLARDFYAEMCRIERWSVRTLRKKVDGMLFERTAISKKPETVIKQEIADLREEGRISADLVFRDPYFLDFLGLKDVYSEKDLESAILRELESFIMELGTGFSFIARQKRITVDEDDFYLDLLFYNRDLRRLVAVELKIDKFHPAHKGQMELYLRWLDKYERKNGEESPLGIILCAGKKKKQIELMELDRSGIHVAEYLTVLPDEKLLQEKLQRAIKAAQERFEKSEREDGQ